MRFQLLKSCTSTCRLPRLELSADLAILGRLDWFDLRWNIFWHFWLLPNDPFSEHPPGFCVESTRRLTLTRGESGTRNSAHVDSARGPANIGWTILFHAPCWTETDETEVVALLPRDEASRPVPWDTADPARLPRLTLRPLMFGEWTLAGSLPCWGPHDLSWAPPQWTCTGELEEPHPAWRAFPGRAQVPHVNKSHIATW